MPDYDLARFKTRVFHSSTAHIPPGGLGCFEANYDPRSEIMDITVRICPRFIDPKGAPVAETIKKRFMDAFQQRVPEFWNNHFVFTCTKKGFEGVRAIPRFAVEESDLESAHYDLKVVNRETGAICVRTGEDPGLASLTDPKWDPYRGKLSAQFAMVSISADQLTKANQMFSAIEAAVKIAYNATPGQAALSVTAMDRLQTHARDLEFMFRGLSKPKLAIVGPGADGKPIAETVGKILQGFGYSGKFEAGKSGPAGFVTITIPPKDLAKARTQVTSGIQNFPHFAQYAVAHEFGHMLGLPDEYLCCGANTVSLLSTHGLAAANSDEREAIIGNTTTQAQDMTPGIARSQEEFVKLCRLFNVPVPPFGRANSSMMATGHQILPAHGVTVANSLARMTHNYFKPGDWRIDVR